MLPTPFQHLMAGLLLDVTITADHRMAAASREPRSGGNRMLVSRRSRVAESRADRHLTRRRLLRAGGATIAAAAIPPLRRPAVSAQGSDASPTPAGTPANGAAIAITGQAVPGLAV